MGRRPDDLNLNITRCWINYSWSLLRDQLQSQADAGLRTGGRFCSSMFPVQMSTQMSLSLFSPPPPPPPCGASWQQMLMPQTKTQSLLQHHWELREQFHSVPLWFHRRSPRSHRSVVVMAAQLVRLRVVPVLHVEHILLFSTVRCSRRGTRVKCSTAGLVQVGLWSSGQRFYNRKVSGSMLSSNRSSREVCVCVCICSLFSVFGSVQKSGVGSFPC